MKYIRTEYSIFEIIKESNCYYGSQPRCWSVKGFHELFKEDDKNFKEYRFSDSVKELCDVTVFVDKHGNHEIIYGSPEQQRTRIEEIIKMGVTEGDAFYGAIWTYKGLIYVAKLNEKGEFELL